MRQVSLDEVGFEVRIHKENLQPRQREYFADLLEIVEHFTGRHYHTRRSSRLHPQIVERFLEEDGERVEPFCTILR
jgi:hypothetical protein